MNYQNKYLKYKNKYFNKLLINLINNQDGGSIGYSISSNRDSENLPLLKYGSVVGINMMFENKLMDLLHKNKDMLNIIYIKHICLNMYMLWKKIKDLISSNQIILSFIKDITDNYGNNIIENYDYIWNICDDIYNIYIILYLFNYDKIDDLFLDIFKLETIKKYKFLKLNNIKIRKKEFNNLINNFRKTNNITEKLSFEKINIQINKENITNEYLKSEIWNIWKYFVDIYPNYLVLNKYADKNNKSVYKDIKEDQNIIKINNFDKDRQFINKKFNLTNQDQKILKNFYTNFENNDIGASNVIITKNNNFYEKLSSCGFVLKSGPSGSTGTIIGFIMCIMDKIDMTEEDFNTYLLTTIIYLFMRSDHSLSEILITIPGYGLFMLKDEHKLTQEEIEKEWGKYNCNYLFDIMNNIIDKSSINNSKIILKIKDLLNERERIINSIMP